MTKNETFNISFKNIVDAAKDIDLVSDIDVNKNYVSIMLFDTDNIEYCLIHVYLASLADYIYSPGIHLKALQSQTDLDYELADALNSCFKNGFETIIIHALK